MPRLLLGAALGGLAMWIVGFIFWGPLLGWIPFSHAADADAAALQATIAQHLGPTGGGTYAIPSPGTAGGTELVGRGPNALVHFINSGLAVPDGGALLGGLVLAIICALTVGVALMTCAGRASFGDRLKLVALFAVGVTAYTDLGQPVFNHLPAGYFVYLWLSDVVSWLAAGAVLAKLLPHPPAVAD